MSFFKRKPTRPPEGFERYEGKVTTRLTPDENELAEHIAHKAACHLAGTRPQTVSIQPFGTGGTKGRIEYGSGPTCTVHYLYADMVYRIARLIEESVPGVTVETYTYTSDYCHAYFKS
jgi:hypothetical protein